jgi:Leucine Rich repeat
MRKIAFAPFFPSIDRSIMRFEFRNDLGLSMAAADEDWRATLERVLRKGKSQLGLYNRFLGDAEAVEFAERLRGDGGNGLRRLWLSTNKIGDGGAFAIAELLQSDKCALEEVYLSDNDIGPDGIAALADALRQSTAVTKLYIFGNRGVDASAEGGSDADAAEGVASLVSAIGVNTTLKAVVVESPVFDPTPRQKALDAALADSEGRRRGRERFLTGPLTKAARAKD